VAHDNTGQGTRRQSAVTMESIRHPEVGRGVRVADLRPDVSADLDVTMKTTPNPDYARSLMSRFMSRTACSSPTMIARAMMLWPMFSSHMLGMAATGRTLR
jgi:hypothetical protein